MFKNIKTFWFFLCLPYLFIIDPKMFRGSGIAAAIGNMYLVVTMILSVIFQLCCLAVLIFLLFLIF